MDQGNSNSAVVSPTCVLSIVMNLIIFTLFNLALLFKLYFSFREAYDFLLI